MSVVVLLMLSLGWLLLLAEDMCTPPAVLLAVKTGSRAVSVVFV